jgi:hypothetical protein
MHFLPLPAARIGIGHGERSRFAHRGFRFADRGAAAAAEAPRLVHRTKVMLRREDAASVRLAAQRGHRRAVSGY